MIASLDIGFVSYTSSCKLIWDDRESNSLIEKSNGRSLRWLVESLPKEYAFKGLQ